MKLHNIHTPYWQKFMLLVAFVICMTIIGSIIGAVVVIFTNNMLLLQALSSIFIFGGSAYLYYLFFERQQFLQQTFCSNLNWMWLFVGILLWVASAPIVTAIGQDSAYGKLVLSMITDTSIIGLIELIVVMALLPAILEEWVFRGILQRLFIQWTKKIWLGIIISSVIFSLIHFDLPNFFARFILGILLGLLYQYSRNIWTNITYHFTNNTIAAITLWLYVRGDIDNTNDSFAWYLVVLSAIIVIAFIVYNEIKNKNSLKNNYMESIAIDSEIE